MIDLTSLKVKIFADGADKAGMVALNEKLWVKGFTTNPTLMRKAGVSDYERFAREILTVIQEKPVSFEVFSDDFQEMERQALKIAGWAKNVYVKIPVTNTKRESAAPLIHRLTQQGVSLNVTAMMTISQMREITDALAGGSPAIVSLFAGRIADSGRDPLPYIQESVKIVSQAPNVELLWASPREVLNLIQAEELGCHIITMTHDLLKKVESIGKDLDDFSQETVQMFYNDAANAGYSL